MANYQELLSKAVGALPENNGASRRDVYEKARKALVAQLRAINPPLPAREITQHRLELEDCIREVEHEVTESLLGGLKDAEPEVIPTQEPPTKKQEADEKAPAAEKKQEPSKKADPEKADAEKSNSAEDDAASKKADKSADKQDAVEKPKDSKTTSAKKIDKAEAEDALSKVSAETKTEKPDEKPDETEKSKTPDKDAPKDEKSNSDAGSTEKTEEKPSDDGKSKDETSSKDNPEIDALDDIIALAEAGKSPEEKSNDSENAEATPKKRVEKPLTTASDKSVGAAMSRVREVDNVAKSTTASSKESAGAVSARLTSPLEGAGITGVGGVSDTAKSKTPEAELAQNVALDETVESGSTDAQSAVDRAIQTLDREARGEKSSNGEIDIQGENHKGAGNNSDRSNNISADLEEEKSGGGLTIFLVLVVLLLGAVGGGGYWAWKEGFVDLGALFATAPAGGEEADNQTAGEETTSDPVRQVGTPQDGTNEANSGPGNTTTTVEVTDPTDPNVALEDPNKSDERLPSADATNPDETSATAGTDEVTPTTQEADGKDEDRLVTETETSDPSLAQEGDVAGTDVTQGGQSLLLEASTDGSTGAIPFSGTADWRRGVDELGEPTLVGEANIPARNLNVKILIRRNGDPSLPASHLMEIDFDVSETFAGGAVAGLPGILLKNEELVQGVALVGASARVVGNSFLFALSAAEQDIRTNLDLLENRKWMDLALIYSSGNRAIITLEKDATAQALFVDVLGAWDNSANGVTNADAAAGEGGAVEAGGEAVAGAVEEAGEAVTEAVSEGTSAVVEGATNLITDATTP